MPSSRYVISILEDNQWTEVSHNGSHVTFKNGAIDDLVTIPHPKKDLPIGLIKKIEKVTGLKLW